MSTSEAGPRRWHAPAAPAAGSHIAWPQAFGTRFILCVDTEEEFDWSAPFRREGWGTRAMSALPAAHRRFRERAVPVTYLIDYPIATDPASIDALRTILADGVSEVGTQLHPWVNPPFDEAVDLQNSFAGNLPRSLEAAKLDRLDGAIAIAFGRAARVYRAGRYGIGPDTLSLLAARGYRVDTSMRSAYDYRAQGGPDFSAVPNHGYRTGAAGSLIELPLTTVFTGQLRRWGRPLHRIAARVPKGRGVLSRLRLVNRVALTPEDMPLREALEAIRIAAGEGVRLLNFSYHSPTVVPAYTPYVRDAAELAGFWQWWDAVLDLLDRLGVTPASMDQVIAAADAALP